MKKFIVSVALLASVCSTFANPLGAMGVNGRSSNGFFDMAYQDSAGYVVQGWACSPENPNFGGVVELYTATKYSQATPGGPIIPAGTPIYLGSVWSNDLREPAVGDACGGNASHGFLGRITPPYLPSGREYHGVYPIYAFYVNSRGVRVQLHQIQGLNF
jgi:hypothetical protein